MDTYREIKKRRDRQKADRDRDGEKGREKRESSKCVCALNAFSLFDY